MTLKYQPNDNGTIMCRKHRITFAEGHDCPQCIDGEGEQHRSSDGESEEQAEHEWRREAFEQQDVALHTKEGTYPYRKPTTSTQRPAAKPKDADSEQAAPEQPFVVRWRLAFLHAAPLPYGKRLKAHPDLKERSLPEGVRYVLLVLSTFMDQNGYCWPSQCAIAERAGRSERSVGANLRQAINHKWLRATARKTARLKPGRPALAYQALIPEHAVRSRQAEVRP